MNIYSTYSDEQLLLLLKQNDQGAFKALYERYWEKLFVTAHFRLSDPAEAEDVVQDVLLNIWRKRETLELKNSLNTYLAAAVKYEIINIFAKRKKIEKHFHISELHLPDNSTEEKLSFTELESRLATLVKALPEKCRMVFTMSREQGYSQKKIARELDISENTVESHIKHALRSLRTGLQQFFTLLSIILIDVALIP